MAPIEEAQTNGGRMFPTGGFCLHKVKLSSVSGEVMGLIRDDVIEKLEKAL
jgi:hypothetical protein